MQEYTNYHFDVAPSHLRGALHRFSRFFVAPLVAAGSLEREVRAVDSEFAGVLQSDHSRLAQLMCHTVRGCLWFCVWCVVCCCCVCV